MAQTNILEMLRKAYLDCFGATTAKLSYMRDYMARIKSKIPTIWSFIGKSPATLIYTKKVQILVSWFTSWMTWTRVFTCASVFMYKMEITIKQTFLQETVKIEWNRYISTTEPVLNASPSSSSLSDDKTRDQSRSYMWSRITVTQLKSNSWVF